MSSHMALRKSSGVVIQESWNGKLYIYIYIFFFDYARINAHVYIYKIYNIVGYIIIVFQQTCE